MATNLSLYTVPAAWLFALAPRGYSVAAYNAHSETKHGPDLKNPRTFIQQVNNDPTLSPLIRDRICRAESAQLNGMENVGFFAAAIVIANVAKLDTTLLNGLSMGYLVSRALHSLISIHNDTDRFVFVRTGVFMVGVAINCTLFVLAGRKLQ